MSATRWLHLRRISYASLAAAAAASTSAFFLRPQSARVRHDAPTSPPWPTNVSLIAEANRAQARYTSQQESEHHSKRGDAQIIDKATDVETYAPAFEDDDEGSWAQFSRNFDIVLEGIKRVEWTGLGDKITDVVLPAWAKHLPERVQKLQFELSMQDGTLAHDIWQEAHDTSINPEILWDAKVRVGKDLSADELKFRQVRKEHVAKSLKKYLELDEDVDPEDVPTIAMCGSGGGLRALVAGTGSYLSAQQAGLFDCVTYTAGVSGSCWLQTLYFSSLGKQNHNTLLHHLKTRIGTHIAFPPPALKLVTSAPTNKFVLSGFVEKLRGDPGATFGLVDVYSLLLAARLMVPNGDLDVQDSDLKLSNQRIHLKDGLHPMPLYTVVRHEIPLEEESAKEETKSIEAESRARERARKEAWFQWIELSPWEVWCEEFGAGIPTWSLGRPFENGSNKILESGVALPEIRQSLLLGIYGSAFCATLAHYYKEIKPLLSGISGFGSLEDMMEQKNDDLIKIHPIEPATIPNFAYGMKDVLPKTCPESIFKSDHLQVMDAGMSNNLPIYPLLRPGRDVDVLVVFDASADVKTENWLSVVDGYAKQRGIKSWPVGTGWPKKTTSSKQNAEAYEKATASNPQEAAQKLAEARDKNRAATAERRKQSDNQAVSRTSDPEGDADDLSYCNIWIGTQLERDSTEEPPPSKRISWNNPEDDTFQLMEPDATTAVIYFPLLPNPKVPGVDPDKTDFMSTWNFIYKPEEVDKVVELAKTNFESGADQTKRTIKAIYERKKKEREAREDKLKAKWWKNQLRNGGDAFAGS